MTNLESLCPNELYSSNLKETSRDFNSIRNPSSKSVYKFKLEDTLSRFYLYIFLYVAYMYLSDVHLYIRDHRLYDH